MEIFDLLYCVNRVKRVKHANGGTEFEKLNPTCWNVTPYYVGTSLPPEQVSEDSKNVL